jgi:hypothetical protein
MGLELEFGNVDFCGGRKTGEPGSHRYATHASHATHAFKKKRKYLPIK